MNNPIRRLRNKSIFHNGIIPLLLSMLISVFVPIFLDNYFLQHYHKALKPEYLFLSMGVSTAVLFGLFSLIRKKPSSKDREKIENSEFPDWLPLNEKIESAVKVDNTKDDLIAYIFLAVIIWLTFIVSIPDVLSKIIITVFLVVLGFIFYAISKYNKNFWENIDDTAIYAEIPVDRIKKVARKGGHDIYAYFYLPDGKYVVKVTKSNLDKLTFVCYKNRIKILEFDSKDIFLKDSSDYKEIAEKMEELREKYLSTPPEELKELLKESDNLDDLDEEIPEEW